MFTKRFWREVVERAAKTAAQAALLAIGQDVGGFDLFGADVASVAGFGAGGAVLSILTSVATAKLGPDEHSPSLV